MIGFILNVIRFLLGVYNLLLIVHVILCWISIPANKWTELLRSIIEPGLMLARKLMDRFLPQLRKPGIDWSPLVLFVAIVLLRIILGWL
ncbi:MAG: YggT family protein [Aristaeellaceae bacterium]